MKKRHITTCWVSADEQYCEQRSEKLEVIKNIN